MNYDLQVLEFTRTLKQERKNQGLNVTAVQVMSGLNHRTLWAWENEINLPTARKLMQWADALGYELKLVKKSSPIEPKKSCGNCLHFEDDCFKCSIGFDAWEPDTSVEGTKP